jgi:uncharacterized protein (TIGR03000 family)
MLRQRFFGIGLAALAIMALAWSPAQAQRFRGGYGYGYGRWNRPYNWDYGYSDYSPYYNYGPYNSGYGSFYGPNDSDMNEGVARIDVHVPPDARVWFDGQRTSQRGEFRRFMSPPLDPDQSFTYEISARWNEGDREVDRTKKVKVHSGSRASVNFLADRREGDSDRRGGDSYDDTGRQGERMPPGDTQRDNRDNKDRNKPPTP